MMKKIKIISKRYKINFFKRSKKTASSTASTESVVEEFLNKIYGVNYEKKVKYNYSPTNKSIKNS